MNGDQILLSTAYLPPAEYFSRILNSGSFVVEYNENYNRQTYRNRCRILGPRGIIVLSIPVTKGGKTKAPVKDVNIDYTKRWQKVHIRAIASCYGRSPFFQFYSEELFSIIDKEYRFLVDLNEDLIVKCLEILDIERSFRSTSSFKTPGGPENDYRYSISPGKEPGVEQKPYIQVFNQDNFVPGLSIIDLIFNTGPDARSFL